MRRVSLAATITMAPWLALAWAQSACAGETTVRLTAAELFTIAERSALTEPDKAMNIYRALERDPDVAIHNEARFRHAKLLVGKRRFAEAIVLFRAILDEQPNAAPVRLELAAALAQTGAVSAARHELRQAQAGGLPPDVSQAVNRYVAALRSTKPWGGAFELTLAPDSNINRATDARTLDAVIAPLTLSDDARQRSGLGLKPSGQVYLRANLGKAVTLVPRLSGQGAFYRASQFNDVSGSAQLGLEWRSQADRITPSAGHTWRWYGGSLYARTESLALDLLHPIGKRAQLDANIGASRARYARNPLQDGAIYNAALTYEHALSARSGGSIALSGNRQTANDPGYATASAGIGVVYWHDLGKMTLFATANANRLEADKRLFLFRDRRQDWYARAGAGAVFRHVHLADFSPVVRIAYERNWSTVGIYDFRRISFDFGLAKTF